MSARGGTPARPGGAAPGTGDRNGISSWLPIIGGLTLGVGLLAVIIKLLSGASDDKAKCLKIDPNKRKWPLEDTSKSSFR
ncbi:uncharacterized protein LOC131852828 [Achroia grisella]|uniref:uncharacterized protein LOC131852828 n=1 Tax=Achroia grisella TaxID=688607 RepID=UPI0027D233F2|nr:uncharacterized protein LOC131852828 [Achroia grisella]